MKKRGTKLFLMFTQDLENVRRSCGRTAGIPFAFQSGAVWECVGVAFLGDDTATSKTERGGSFQLNETGQDADQSGDLGQGKHV